MEAVVTPSSRIRLHPVDDQSPPRVELPTERVLRWRSPFADEAASPAVSVLVTPYAFVRFCAHAGSDLDHEVGGGLVGERFIDNRSGRAFTLVEAVLPARFTRQGSAYLTFTQETLVAMNEELEARFPYLQLVGWYHTHPGMGVFLSHYDLWLHRHFFPERWQVALVIEPYASLGGFFIRQRDGRLDPQRYFGFYELLEEGSPSAVHWNNLRPGTELPPDLEEVDDE